MLDDPQAAGLPAIIPDNAGREIALPAFAEMVRDAVDFASASKADRTVEEYGRCFRAFERWCHDFLRCPMPAAPETVAAYLGDMAKRGRKAAYIDLHAAAIAFHHKLKRHESPTGTEAVRATLEGIRRKIGVKPARKSPATAEVVKRLIKSCPDTQIGRRDAALIALGFAAALRRSELVALDVSHIERTPEGMIVHIDRSKTDQVGAGHQVSVLNGSKLKPAQALDAWLKGAGIASGPLFRHIRRGDNVTADRLKDRAVAEIVKARVKGVGLNEDFFSGHSLRSGFVTSALDTGADMLKIMDVTRHTQIKTLKVYDRREKFKNHAGRGFL